MNNTHKNIIDDMAKVGFFIEEQCDMPKTEFKVFVTNNSRPLVHIHIKHKEEEKFVCVEFNSAEYFIHNKYIYTLTNTEAKAFDTFLKLPYKYAQTFLLGEIKFKVETYWEYAIYQWILENNNSDDNLGLKVDKNGFVIFPKQPDYSKLNNIEHKHSTKIIQDNKDDFEIFDPNKKPYTIEEEVLAERLSYLIQNFIVDDKNNGDFTHNHNLLDRFIQHCIAGDPNKKSKRTHIYYDFNNKDKFRVYSNNVLKKVLDTNHKISSISKVNVLTNELKNLFKGNYEIFFYRSSGFYNKQERVKIGLHSFSSNVTTNYTNAKTIDLLILDSCDKLIDIYPIDATYFELEFNNILKRPFTLNIIVP